MATDTGKDAGGKASPAKKTKRFKWTIRFAIAFVLYTIVGFFVVPAVIKSQMLKRLPDLTKRAPAVEQVKFNPYTLALTIRGFSLKEPSGDVFVSFDEFFVEFQLWSSIFHRGMVFNEISLKDPFGQVTYLPGGQFNFSNLLTNSAPATNAPPAKPQPLPSVTIYHLSITNAALSFTDQNRKTPFHTEFKPIDINLTNLTTIHNKDAPYSIIARDDAGEVFAWKGSVTVDPLRSDGTFRLGGLRLGKYSNYAHDFATFEIANGILDIASDYRYDSTTNALDLSVSNTAVHLSNLELKAPGKGETVLSIPSLAVTGTEANVANRTARVGLVKSSGGSILVRQNKDSTINLLSMLILPTNAPTATNATVSTNAPAAPFSAKIDEIAFDNYSIITEDKKPEKPASFKLDQLGFDIKNVSNASNAPVTVALSLRFQDTGNVAVNGSATLMPPSADLQLAVTNIDLRSIQPYVEEQIKLVITSGAVDVNGHARYAPPATNAPLVSFDGSVAVNKFDTADDVLFKDFAKWDALNIDGIHVQLQPMQAHVEQIKFTGLSASLIVGSNRIANVQNIFRNQIAAQTNAMHTNLTGAATIETIPQPALPTNLDVSLGAFVLENASLHFADQSIEPHCAFDVQQFGATIKGLSLQPDATATIDVSGKVDDRSPFSVNGKLSPGEMDPKLKNLFTDIAVAFTNVELTAFTPYSEKFAGYQLQKGKLSFAVHYLVDKQALKAENGFYIDQFTFGAASGSPDATKLPVRFAIKLLKDRHGRIMLDVPLSGRTDDPKFRVGPIIWQVVMNLLEKAATSPFSLLGAAFGGGEEMSFVSFQPADAAIPDSETNKLNILAKGLYEHPDVTVEINGSVDPAQDRDLIARAKFEQQLKSIWIKEQTDAGKPAFAMEDVRLNPKDHDRLVKKAYVATFGPYKPPGQTNVEAPVAGVPEKPVPPPPPLLKSDEFEHGASKLVDFAKSEPSLEEKIAAQKGATSKLTPRSAAKSTLTKSKTTVAATAATTPAPPAPAPGTDAAELADMESQLLQKVEITQDDLRDLMNQRAAKVQAYLVQTGKVTVDRLFITPPKPMTTSSKGEDKVNMSLQ